MTRTYRAVVFDLDGVLWDGEPLYHEAFNVVLKPLGLRVTDEDYTNIIGHSVESAWAWVIEHFRLDGDPRAYYRAYDEAVMRLLEEPIEPLPGVRELLGEIMRRGIPVGLASASLRNWVDATIARLGMADAFAATVCAGEVPHAKPAPDLYLAAAKALGVPPEDCVAIEDTATGIAAAKAAGMYAVQARASSTALPPLPQADLVIESYSQLDLRILCHSEQSEESVDDRRG